MRQFVVIVALLMTLITIDATAETKQLNFTDFDEISVGYGMQVSINQGAIYRIETIGSPADLDRLRVEHRGSRLTFTTDSGFWGLFQSSDRISLNITLPALRAVSLSGGSHGTLNVQRGSSAFAAALSGGSRLSGQLACGDIQMSVSGGSRVDLSGTGQRLVLHGSGGSRYELKNFPVKDVVSSLSGGSQATMTLEGKIDADLSGGSHITYFGNAAIAAVRANGGSRVQKGL
jgi:Putative auto-transporter adhesin, head GIN domain